MADETLRAKAFARKPQQERARARCECVLDEARKLLVERGLSGFSIPDLAARLGYSRAAIYNFFPTPYAIFNELSQRYLAQLEALLYRKAAELTALSWQEGAREFAALAAKFYNKNPAARILILGGPMSSESYVAQSIVIQRLGGLVEWLFAERGVTLPNGPPNVALLAVELGTACYRVAFALHGKVTPEYEHEASKVMIAYLSPYVADGGAHPQITTLERRQ